ncbi:hypothetical protein Ga0466249_005353 [Sporomusaceae bacterium BoRhaA]|uniref:hypothetical protein n=1 Tax=Pelorhabdus rhamnosifermentans TaxID=2772457 RepID=UPI001C063371|nr:hypothetical protein [Pelorhabdus rhamnosifermentans]MBU2704199.1 hypothetical protein [Pelorhabdus rhamnosifermentans]
MSDSVEASTSLNSIFKPTLRNNCQPTFFELAILNIDQCPCDGQAITYWQAADPINGFIFIANKGHSVMKVTITQSDSRPPLTDTILPCQSKFFSSTLLTGFTIECIGYTCEANKCIGEAIIMLNAI